MISTRTPLYTGERPTVLDRRAERARDAQPERDGYLAKLIKYVPGEIVAVFAAIMAASSNVSDSPDVQHGVTRAVIVFFLFATPAYFYLLAARLPEPERPAIYFYVLSVVAFFIWAMAVSVQVRDELGINARMAEFLLAIGAFAVPFCDEILTTVISQRRPAE